MAKTVLVVDDSSSLRTVIKMALTRSSELMIDDLPEKVRAYRATQLVVSGDDPAELVTLDEMERLYVRRVLAAVGGNKSQAARVLGIDRRSLYRRLEGGAAGAGQGDAGDAG